MKNIRIIFASLLIALPLSANTRHQMNFYTNFFKAGYTPGLSYLYLFGKRFGLEIGGNYALGASTVNVTYRGFGFNALLTYEINTAKEQSLILKGGAAYREFITEYQSLSLAVRSREVSYYNFGFDYFYRIKRFGKLGLSYFADGYGIVYRIEF